MPVFFFLVFQDTFSQIGRPVATQSSLTSIVTICPSCGKTRAMLRAVVPANVPREKDILIESISLKIMT